MASANKRMPMLSRFVAVAITVVAFTAAMSTYAQDQMWRMADPLVEVDLLDPPDAPIRRYALTARHAPVREVPIPDSQQLFCTLSLAHNVVLNYYRDIDTWVFQIDASDDARRAAGGLATCLDLTQRPGPGE